jgi:uncharacterized protein (DUF4415 family)
VESTRTATETRTNIFLKEAVNERYDRYLLDAFRAGGDGWQSGMTHVVREWATEHGLFNGKGP